MKAFKLALLCFVVTAAAQSSSADCVRSLEDLSANPNRSLDFLRKTPLKYATAGNKQRFSLTTRDKTIDGKNSKAFFGRWDGSGLGGDLYIKGICVDGSKLTVTLENNKKYNAEISGNNIIFTISLLGLEKKYIFLPL